jgi:hypothetical protein
MQLGILRARFLFRKEGYEASEQTLEIDGGSFCVCGRNICASPTGADLSATFVHTSRTVNEAGANTPAQEHFGRLEIESR